MKKKIFADLTKEELWKLRNEIVLYSCMIKDYDNSFDFYPNDICSFFDGYANYLDELAVDDGSEYPALEYDNEDNLWDWFNCCEDYSWVRHCIRENIEVPQSMTFFSQNILKIIFHI